MAEKEVVRPPCCTAGWQAVTTLLTSFRWA